MNQKPNDMIDEIEVSLNSGDKVAVSLTNEDDIRLKFFSRNNGEFQCEQVFSVKELQKVVNSAKLIFESK